MAVIGEREGVVSVVIEMLENISSRLGKDVRITSGKRHGDINSSAHNSGIAVDCKVAGFSTIAMADELVKAGFSAVGEYYRTSGSEWDFAHGDIRGLRGSENSGEYAPGGTKSRKTCWTGNGDDGRTWDYDWGTRKSGHGCPV